MGSSSVSSDRRAGRSPTASITVPADILAALERVATSESRSRSRQAVHYLRRCLVADGHLPVESSP
jgi:hypothetical protein